MGRRNSLYCSSEVHRRHYVADTAAADTNLFSRVDWADWLAIVGTSNAVSATVVLQHTVEPDVAKRNLSTVASMRRIAKEIRSVRQKPQ